MYKHYLEVVNEKLDIARKLNNGGCGGSYYESILIISSILSATASILWPGDGIDRMRFVELLVRFNSEQNEFSKISLPILEESNLLNEAQREILLGALFEKDSTQVITGVEVDTFESYITMKCSDIELVKIREHSYANIFYKYVRSYLVHEYSLSKKVSNFPQTEKNVFISYVNYLRSPNRRICFHFDELNEIVKRIVRNVSEVIECAPLDKPNNWWLDGR